MKIIIDIILLIIIALCTWGGYKKGVVGGVAGILAVAIAMICGNMLASAYSSEMVPAFKPFISGYMDSQSNRETILAQLGYAGSDRSLADILSADPSLRQDYAYQCMLNVGCYDLRAEELAKQAVELADSESIDITEAVVDVQADTAMYVICVTVAFLLVLILLTAIGNIFNFSFRLPNMESLDEIGGAALGFLKGFLLCVLLSWLLSFMGIIIGKETVAGTTLARFFLSFKFITNSIM